MILVAGVFVASELMLLFRRDWMCVPVDQRSREFICGGEHTPFPLRIFSGVSLVLAACAFVMSVVNAFRQRLGAWGKCGLALSALIAVGVIAAVVFVGESDSP